MAAQPVPKTKGRGRYGEDGAGNTGGEEEEAVRIFRTAK